MKFRIRKIEVYTAIIFSLLVSIGIGYSLLNTKLSINGVSLISKNTWSVYFDNLVENGDGITVNVPAYIKNDRLSIGVGLTLEKPGDVYGFTVDVVNDGTIDAVLEKIEITGLSDSQKKSIDCGVRYASGARIMVNDSLKTGTRNKIEFYVKYRTNISVEDLPTEDQAISLKIVMQYAQDSGNSVDVKRLAFIISRSAVLDNAGSEFVINGSGIDFSLGSSDTNGKGVYTLSSTAGDANPIYYYRGSVAHNNVKFANFCWKMVRTTSTGGVKLLYNGIPNADGGCNNTSSNSQISASAFNNDATSAGSIAEVGYKFGNQYKVTSRSTATTIGFVYANYVTYDFTANQYTLQDTFVSTSDWQNNYTEINEKYHYTCFSTDSVCSEVYYIYYGGNPTISYYLPLTNGKVIEDIVNEQTVNSTNANNSIIKEVLENWYKENMTDYTDILEDTVWCNDRSVYNYNGWNKDISSQTDGLYFNGYDRTSLKFTPFLGCINSNDSFTVSIANGNGHLTYPVGLLTSDEALLGGTGNSYLNSAGDFWLLTPSHFARDGAHNYYFTNTGQILSSNIVNTELGVRPVISLKTGMVVKSGIGTVDDPFVVE